MKGVSKAGTLCYASHLLHEKCSRTIFLEGIAAEGKLRLLGCRAERYGRTQQRLRHPEKHD
jgi:hypothetical protein